MIKHTETTILPFTVSELYDLVKDIESYPEFLPWCSHAEIISRKGNHLIADMTVNFKAFHQSYRSDVTLIPPKNESATINVELVEGPFDHLYNAWHFTKLNKRETQVSFTIDFAFQSTILQMMMGKVFDRALTKMIDAFRIRAEALYK